MSGFSCKRCGYKTPLLCNLKKHLTRKFTCDPLLCDDSVQTLLNALPNVSNKEKSFCCDECDKQFTSRSGLFSHKKKQHSAEINNGITNQIVVRNYVDELEMMKEKYERLENRQKELETIIQTRMGNTIATIGSNNNNNSIQNIIINNFGSENTSHLSKDFLDDCMKKLNTGMKNLMKEIHFNPDVPENHNIRLLSKKQNLLETFEDGLWHPRDKNNTLDEMIKQGYRILFKHFIEATSESDTSEQPLNEHINKYFVNLMNKETDDYYKLRRDLFVMILDNTLYILTR